jgi:threonine synthase
VGYAALQQNLTTHTNTTGIFLETAHPAKFMDVVEKTLRVKIKVPNALQEVANKTKRAVKMKADYSLLKEYLFKN